jgi:hypothetical protein
LAAQIGRHSAATSRCHAALAGLAVIITKVRRVSVHGEARRVARAHAKVNKSDRVARLDTLHLFREHLVLVSRQTAAGMQPVSGVRPLAGATAHVTVTGCDVAIAVHWVDGAELSGAD